MLIRTQDKNCLIELKEIKLSIINDSYSIDDLGEIHFVDRYIIKAHINTKKENLGIYSSRKKAQKILDMIQKAYLSANYRNHSGCVMNTVFEMPTDDEVEV